MKQFSTKQDAINYCSSLSVSELTKLCGELLFNSQKEKTRITVTQEQFNTITNMFKIAGVREDGGIETRGRKKNVKDAA